MSELRREEAKGRVGKTIVAVEAKTSAELVVVMRHESGHYLHADLVFGAFAALALLCFFLYSPEPFDFTYFPLEQGAAFLFGVVACAHLPPLRRALVSKRLREANVTEAAKAAFVDKGVSRTTGRTGVLVYVSAFERDAHVVADIGLDPKRLGAPFEEAREAIREAARSGSIDDFVAALEQMGTRLGELYPRGPDDVDELSDEVAA